MGNEQYFLHIEISSHLKTDVFYEVKYALCLKDSNHTDDLVEQDIVGFYPKRDDAESCFDEIVSIFPDAKLKCSIYEMAKFIIRKNNT